MWFLLGKLERWFEAKALERHDKQEDYAYRSGFRWAMERYWIDKEPSDYIEECARPIAGNTPTGNSYYRGACYAMHLVDQMAEISQALNERLEHGITQAKEQQ